MDKDSKVYLSCPNYGYPKWARDRAREIQNRMNADGIGWIVNRSQILSHMPYGFNPDHKQYMTLCYAMLDTCDTIYLMSGWRNSEICRKEKRWAEAHGMKIEEEKHDDMEDYR